MDSLDKYLGQKEKDKVCISGDVVVDTSDLTIGGRVKDESQWWLYNEQMIKRADKMGGGLVY